MIHQALLVSSLVCLAAQAQAPADDFTQWISFDFSNYQPSFPKTTIKGGCKVRIESVYFVGNFDMRGDFRKFYFRELENTEANKENHAKTQPQLQVALQRWLEQKGFEVVSDPSCQATVALEMNLATNGGYSGHVNGSTGLYEPRNMVIKNEARYGNVDAVKAFPQAQLAFSKNGTVVGGTKLLDAARVTAACDVNPPLKGAGLFSGKVYSGQDLVANKPFIDALNTVIEISITKCLDKFGTARAFDDEAIKDIARDLR